MPNHLNNITDTDRINQMNMLVPNMGVREFQLRNNLVKSVSDGTWRQWSDPKWSDAWADLNNPNCFNNPETDVFKTALLKKDGELLDFLLRRGWNVHRMITQKGYPLVGRDGPSYSAISFAVTAGWDDGLKIMLAHKADPNKLDDHGETVFGIAVSARKKRAAKMLLRAGADINGRAKNGKTPLRKLMLGMDVADMVKWLVANGVALDGSLAQNQHGLSPLMESLRDQEGLDVVKALIDGGAKVWARDMKGKTPAHYAAHSNWPEALDVLVAHGADPNALDYEGNTLWHEALLADDNMLDKSFKGLTPTRQWLTKHAQKSCDHINAAGERPLSVAVGRRKVTYVNALLDLGVKAHQEFLSTPSTLVGRYIQDCCDKHQNFSINFLDKLIVAGAQINQADIEGVTPLMIASEGGSVEMVKALLASGSDPNVVDHNGVTSLIKALRSAAQGKGQHYHIEKIEALLASGARTHGRLDNYSAMEYATLFVKPAVPLIAAAVQKEYLMGQVLTGSSVKLPKKQKPTQRKF